MLEAERLATTAYYEHFRQGGCSNVCAAGVRRTSRPGELNSGTISSTLVDVFGCILLRVYTIHQVYAYLKRLGYTVTRSQAPSAFYPMAQALLRPTGTKSSLNTMLAAVTRLFWMPLRNLLSPSRHWWKPLDLGCLVHTWPSYCMSADTLGIFKELTDEFLASIFSCLRFIQSGHEKTLPIAELSQLSPHNLQSSYQPFYNLYKPSTPFRRTHPPTPDFSLVVVECVVHPVRKAMLNVFYHSGRTTPMPTLGELDRLLDVAPDPPSIKPRQKQQPRGPPSSLKDSKACAEATDRTHTLYGQESIFVRFLRWLRILPGVNNGPPPRRQNPMQALKAGKRIIVVAVVDVGMISFYRFGQGAFDQWPMA